MACSHEPAGVGANSPRELQSERRLQYLVATPAAVMPDLSKATTTEVEPVGADERLEHWVKKNMRGYGFSVVGDTSEPHDVELRLAVESRGVGRLMRGRAAMQMIAGGRVLGQWDTDEHVESTHGFDPALAHDLVAKLASSPGVVSYADSIYGQRIRPLKETVGRRAYIPEYGGTPPLEMTDDVTPPRSEVASEEATAPPPPTPGNVAAARPIADKGNSLYADGHFAEAYSQFEDAFLLSQDPLYMFEMGECQRGLGNAGDAASFYRDYQRRAPDGPKAAETASRLRELTAAGAK
ncbi:MAG TPA: hypothetical protein VGL13_06480 [Polyangiaceae bacterium]